MDAGELEAVSFSKEMTTLPMSGTGSRRSVLNGQSFKPRRARFRFDLSDSEAGGEQTLPERGRQASMSWQAASAAASSSSENARVGGFVRCGKNDAGACAEGTAHIGLRHGSLRPVHEGPDFSGLCWDAWSRVDLRGCREALRRMRWHAADSNGLRREMGEWPVLRTEGRRQKEKRSGNRSASHLVARSRFELLISALRGRRPKPLDERAICKASKWPRKIW